MMTLSLQEVLIVGASSDQVKFSELTLDMFRMLQTLEREPQEDMISQLYDASPAPGKLASAGGNPLENGAAIGGAGSGGGMGLKRENPHKYLLYKPTVSQFSVFLASGQKELPANGALMLYISGDGCFSTKPAPEDLSYDLGGVLLSSKRDYEQLQSIINSKLTPHTKEPNCLYPGDLQPFTRRPTFLVVDSDNSSAFANVPHHFDQPLVVLMSPQEVPPSFRGILLLRIVCIWPLNLMFVTSLWIARKLTDDCFTPIVIAANNLFTVIGSSYSSSNCIPYF